MLGYLLGWGCKMLGEVQKRLRDLTVVGEIVRGCEKRWEILWNVGLSLSRLAQVKFS